ncbi:uncharacterized protein F4822DRAFT_412207 [Hypoxylon trugodes]|uniref:uncharacterized protein n=1 Tax=Hypoxylon trugodes TaxID=326681 RepID=UPI0021A1F01B|nr:uncharacterized protein F4822DRAFT_412207 [Hypoxylon trugodes]KAI1385163.1 hypothetical protein F4822DRAFT_412207 [Hypoxylon trugodes]
MMRFFILSAVLLAPLGVIAAPPPKLHDAGSNVVIPPPCIAMDPPPSEDETQMRFGKFAYAFIIKKNLTEAFEYVSSTYINHQPLAGEDGPDAALKVLGPMWEEKTLIPLRTAFKSDQGWLDYMASGAGEIIDRFRWEAGCIVEHWDDGGKFPDF